MSFVQTLISVKVSNASTTVQLQCLINGTGQHLRSVFIKIHNLNNSTFEKKKILAEINSLTQQSRGDLD